MTPPDGAFCRPRWSSPWRRACAATAVGLAAIHWYGTAAQHWMPRAAPVSASQLQLRLDPNTATRAELDLLPRIGATLAQNIIAYREAAPEQPAFRRAEDLDRVRRIGPATVEALRPYLRFSDVPGPATPEP